MHGNGRTLQQVRSSRSSHDIVASNMELRLQREKQFFSQRDEESVLDDEPVRKKKRENVDDEIDDDDNTVVAVNTMNTSQLEALPTELLHMIFSYLSTYDKVSLRMVCRRLRFIMDDPDHWRCVVIPPHISAKNPKYVQSVLKRTKLHVQALSLVGYSSTTSSYLTSCTSVTALDLYGSRITNSAMKQLLLRLPNLSRLSISDGAAQALLPMLPALQQLVITMRPLSHKLITCNFEHLYSQLVEEDSPAKPFNVAIKCIDYASYYFEKLEQFRGYRFGYLSGYEWSTMNMLMLTVTPSFVSNNSAEMGFRIPGVLDANNKPPIIVSTAVSSSVLSANVNYTHGFVADSASSHASTICPPSFGDIAALNITSLDLKGITLQSLDDVRNIVEFTPNLLVISVNSIRLSSYDDPLDVLFEALSLYCPKLTSIFAALVYSAQQCSVKNACELWNNILSLKHLEHLSICSCLFQGSPATPNDYHLCPNLQLLPISFQSLILQIHQTSPVQAANLDTIITNICNIHRLRMLHLYIDRSYSFRQQDMTEPLVLDFQLLLENCTELEELVVDPSWRVPVQIRSSSSISQLKCLKLSMDHCSVPESFFNDLVPFGQKNMNLQVLYLQVSNYLRHSEVIRIMEHCPSLVSFTSSVFEAGAKDIAKKHNLLNFHDWLYPTPNCQSILSKINFSVLKMM